MDKNVGFSTAPDKPELVYRRALLPWPEPVRLEPGDSVHLDLKTNLVGDDYVWRWNTKVSACRRHERPKADFHQSTFSGAVLSTGQLRKQADEYTPTLNADGQIEFFALSQMDGSRRLIDIAQEITDRFPQRFPDTCEALAWVKTRSKLYSR